MYITTNFSRHRYPAKFAACYVLICVLLLLAACHETPATRYGYVAMLGQDTVSVETVTRQGDIVESDEVDRFPQVHIRHTVVKLNDDGSIRHLEMKIHTPSEPSNQRDRTVVADVSHNNVHLSKTDSSGKVEKDFATGGAMVVAHVPQMYSLYELYFAAAFKQSPAAGSAVKLRQFYIDREFDRFPLGHATVTVGSGKAEIMHDWLAGIGEAVMDSSGNMGSYSGARTTYKVEVKRLATPPDVKAIAAGFEAKETATGGVRELSVRDSIRVQVGNAMMTIDYARPLIRGRVLLGDVIPYDRVWRTGANAATQFTTTAPIKLGGLQIAAGTYTLFTVPHKSVVELIVNKQSGQWGTEYHGSQDLGTIRIASEVSATPVEAFTISIIPGDAHHGKLVLEWGTFRWIAPIEVQ